MAGKRLLLIGWLAVCLVVGIACAATRDSRIPAQDAPPACSADVTFPLALDNTWVYSGTAYTGFNPTAIFTATYVVTESVVELQSRSPYTVMRIHREQRPQSVPLDAGGWSPEKLTKTEDYWYIVERATIYRQEGALDLDTLRSSTATSTSEIEVVFPLAVGQRWYLNEKMQNLYPDYRVDSMLRKVVRQGTVTTPAATFEECFQMTDIIGGYTFEMWFCPGIGIVTRRADHSGTPSGRRELLVDYRIP